jgi:hypothetical protein
MTSQEITPKKPVKDPCDVIAIMTAPDGSVIATHADFDWSIPGGCKLWEGQKWRAREQVKWSAIRAYCSDVIVQSISSYLSTQVAEALCSKGGHKITYRAIGYPDDAAAEVERS